MKKYILTVCILLSWMGAKSQNSNELVRLLNNYIQYSNSNIQALSDACNTLESYNRLFNGYIKGARNLGGEEWESPKRSPFLDDEIFTINEDNPDFLYSVAIKESRGLPVEVQTELNKNAKGLKECSEKMVLLLDSMSNIFSGPLIPVTKNTEVLPFLLLREAKEALVKSKLHRDQLFSAIRNYYGKISRNNPPENNYLQSVKPLARGVEICENITSDLSRNDSSRIGQYVKSLDSLISYLESSELSLLKGVQHYGDSKHFPNKGVVNGFDLYLKFEYITEQLQIFSETGKKFKGNAGTENYPISKCYSFHKACCTRFNSILGLLYYYNEYVLLIGGGKMKLLSEGLSSSGFIYKGWGDESHSLPVKTQLLWMKETPRFEIENW